MMSEIREVGRQKTGGTPGVGGEIPLLLMSDLLVLSRADFLRMFLVFRYPIMRRFS
jgi:hypothetical protein